MLAVQTTPYAIRSTGLAGTGTFARLNARGRLASYSGRGTTYKQEVRRITDVPDIDAIAARFAADEKRTGLATSLSPRDTVRARLGTAEVTLDYSRPSRRGRTLGGDLIPYDRVWRTGANAATQLTNTAPIELAGVPLHPGTYTLWTLPSRGGVSLIINGQSGQWGTSYNAGLDVARRPMTVERPEVRVEHRVRLDGAAANRPGRVVGIATGQHERAQSHHGESEGRLDMACQKPHRGTHSEPPVRGLRVSHPARGEGGHQTR